MRNQEPMSDLSDAWQWFYHRTICMNVIAWAYKWGTWQFSRVGAVFAWFDKDSSDSCSTGIHHAEPRTSGRLVKCMAMILSQNNLQWMSLLGHINWDTWWFARVSAAFAWFDKDSSDSCSTGIHHAEPRPSERLVRCMTMILSQNNLQWMSLLGRINRDNWQFNRHSPCRTKNRWASC